MERLDLNILIWFEHNEGLDEMKNNKFAEESGLRIQESERQARNRSEWKLRVHGGKGVE